MRTREEIGADIKTTKTSVSVLEFKIHRLEKELAELEDPQPVPDMDGYEAKVRSMMPDGKWFVQSTSSELTMQCVGPVRPTKREAVEVWNKMMEPFQNKVDERQDIPDITVNMPPLEPWVKRPDKPWIIEEDGKRFAVFPVRVEIPEERAAALSVDICGRIFMYKDCVPYFNDDMGCIKEITHRPNPGEPQQRRMNHEKQNNHQRNHHFFNASHLRTCKSPKIQQARTM